MLSIGACFLSPPRPYKVTDWIWYHGKSHMYPPYPRDSNYPLPQNMCPLIRWYQDVLGWHWYSGGRYSPFLPYNPYAWLSKEGVTNFKCWVASISHAQTSEHFSQTQLGEISKHQMEVFLGALFLVEMQMPGYQQTVSTVLHCYPQTSREKTTSHNRCTAPHPPPWPKRS